LPREPSEQEERPDARVPEQGRSRKRRRRWLWGLIVAGAALVLAVSVGGLVSWHFSGAVVVPDHSPWPADVTIEAVEPGRIVLERTDATSRPGYIGISWQGGHATVGPVLGEDDEKVARRLVDHNGYLVAGREAALDDVYAGDPRQALGLPFAPVEIDGELGRMPAWLVPARGEPAAARRGPPLTWAIFVHGINGSPENGLRTARLLHRLEIPTLYITYREDLGAPGSPDGYHHMGLTEWRDLEAAARHALDHGARRLLLIGHSMGGSVVARFMELSPLAETVDALVLDAPALNWKRILEFNATEMGLPGFGALPVEWAVGARIDADWEGVDALGQTEDFQLPILLFHGLEDEVVPIETSDEFAARLPRWVSYFRVPEAEHTHSWNVDPPLYEKRLARFLRDALNLPGESVEFTLMKPEKEKGPTEVGP
jgi:alpha-beta hydrolase superfamily lysophospholipase